MTDKNTLTVSNVGGRVKIIDSYKQQVTITFGVFSQHTLTISRDNETAEYQNNSLVQEAKDALHKTLDESILADENTRKKIKKDLNKALQPGSYKKFSFEVVDTKETVLDRFTSNFYSDPDVKEILGKQYTARGK